MHVTHDSLEIIKLALEPHKMSEMQQQVELEKIQLERENSEREDRERERKSELKKNKIRQTKTIKRS